MGNTEIIFNSIHAIVDNQIIDKEKFLCAYNLSSAKLITCTNNKSWISLSKLTIILKSLLFQVSGLFMKKYSAFTRHILLKSAEK
jgi:hypothetical protein